MNIETKTNEDQISPLDRAKKACQAVMRQFAADRLPPAGRWHYHQGVFLLGVQRYWQESGEKQYFQYVKDWVDSIILPDGTIQKYNATELDGLQAGIVLFDLYDRTGDERYKKALYTLVAHLREWKRNSAGGFWHKEVYPNQMWLDGLFMVGPLAVRFGNRFKENGFFDMIVEQALLMWEKTFDERKGLLYHGWDESKKAIWADPVTGRAPEFWGRAIGWYPAAILDILDYLPPNYAARRALIERLNRLLISIAKYQDGATGLWYQVVDKGDRPDNWLEASCSALFVYAIAKAIRRGYLDSRYLQYAWKGYRGVMATLKFDDRGNMVIGGICIGTGIGDYAHYIARPRSENDLHGVGAFIIMCVEMSRAKAEGDQPVF
jgi:unsaturated rhamnogalacturonyl hydrolase